MTEEEQNENVPNLFDGEMMTSCKTLGNGKGQVQIFFQDNLTKNERIALLINMMKFMKDTLQGERPELFDV